MYVSGLFPVPIAEINERPPSEEELSFIKNVETELNFGNLTSKDTYILEREELSSLHTLITSRINSFLHEELGAPKSCGLRITQSWCNYTDSDQFHHKHNHPNSILSGVYYPLAEHPDDRLQFINPLEPYMSLIYTPEVDNAFNAKTWWLPAKTGSLLLFPSYLQHVVVPLKERPSTRISLAFNTFYTGTIGNTRDLTELKLAE